MKKKSYYLKIKDKIRKFEKGLLGFNQRSSWRNRFFDLSLDLLCVTGSDGYFRQVNPAWERTFGWTYKQLIKRPLIDFIHPDDKPLTKLAFEKIKKRGAVFELECRFKTKRGEWIWLSWNAYPVPEEDIIFAQARNVNDQRFVNEKLHSSKEHYRSFIEQSSEGVWHKAFKIPISVELPPDEQARLIYSAGYISECNDAYARMYGYEKRQDIRGKSVGETHSDNNKAGNFSADLQFVENKYRIENFETVETTQAGDKRYFVNNAIGFIKNNHLVGIWGMQRDITDQKLAEEQLRWSETNYREIFDSYAEGIFVHDAETGDVIDVNRTTIEMYGLSGKEEAIHYFNNLPNHDHPSYNPDQAKKSIRRTVKEGPQIFEWLTEDNKGRRFWIEVILKVVQVAGEKRVLAMIKDIDDRKYAQDALKENEQRYRTLFESSSDAIFIVNHNTIVDCNKKALQVFKASRGMVIGQDVIKFLSNDFGKLKLEEQLLTTAHGDGHIFEWPCYNRQDDCFEAEIKTSLIDFGGERRLQIIIRDLSETKKVQESIRASEEKFSGIFRISPNAIAISRLSDQKIVDVNEAFEKMSGYSKNELIGKTWEETNLIHKDSQQEELINQFKEKGELNNFELDYIDRQKRTITALLSLKTIFVDEEKCLLSIAHDITMRKNMEEELRYRNRFEKLGSELSTRFINLPFAEIDAEIEKALQEVCKFTRSDLGYVFRINDEWTKRKITYFWADDSMTLGKMKFESQDIKTTPWWMGKIADQKVVAISSLDDLPDIAQEEKHFFNQLKINAAIEAPMVYQGRVFGILGLASTAKKRLWTENETALLKMVGQVFTNTLHRKEAEKALHKSEEIIQHMSDVVWIIDEKGRVQFETPSSSRVLGYDPGLLIGQIGFDLIHPDDLAAVMKNFNDVLEKKNDLVPGEYRFKHKDGHWVELEVVAANMLHHDGIRGIILSARDISAKKQTESALIESEDKYRNIFQNIKDVYFEVTLGGILTEVSPAISDLTGHNRADLIGRSLSQLFNDPADSELFLNKIERDSCLSDFDICLSHIDGKEKICSINAELSVENNGSSQKIFGTIRDVTESKRLHDQLNQSQRMESIGTLAGGIAHDFNNLLTVIMGHAELTSLNMDNENPFYKDVIAILNAGRKAEKLTRQLLTFSRKQIFETKILNLNKIISDLDKMTRRLIGEDIRIETKLSKDVPNIKADPGQIEQVLINLLVNARDAIHDAKHTSNDNLITLETGRVYLNKETVHLHPDVSEGWHVFFVVRDNGVGMDNETTDKIFEPFFTTKDISKGTGLGLSTVYGVVKQNRGYIDVHSKPGQGTTIKIYWPISDESQIENQEKAISEVELNGNESILLVEDDEAVRTFAGTALRSFGYNIYEAADGLEALTFIKKNNEPIDLVMTDVVMPGMGGKELSDRLSELLPDVKLLFTSGYTDRQIIEKGVIKQDLNFLGKPYSIQTLALKIRNVLNS